MSAHRIFTRPTPPSSRCGDLMASVAPRADATEYHTSWCPCRKCASDWDAAHPRRRPLLTGLLIAVIASAAIALFIGVPA